ncbi:hypothetical protein V6N13_041372 [Hibiscus sabdariffa]|uniref:Uncharacterized protein n=1 Tax=Hibiscus sabdariffa TaxID=183260 RepID=A0ABR2RB50_9ROSI
MEKVVINHRLLNGYGTDSEQTTNLRTKCCKLARGIVMSEPEPRAARRPELDLPRVSFMLMMEFLIFLYGG